MLSHDGELIAIEGPGLFQDSNWNSGLADIVKKARERQPLLVQAGKSKLSAECHGQCGDQQAMLVGLAVMLANAINPAHKPLRLDVSDDGFAGRVDSLRIKWGAQ